MISITYHWLWCFSITPPSLSKHTKAGYAKIDFYFAQDQSPSQIFDRIQILDNCKYDYSVQCFFWHKADRAGRSNSLGLFTTPENVLVVEKTTFTRTFYLDVSTRKSTKLIEKKFGTTRNESHSWQRVKDRLLMVSRDKQKWNYLLLLF